MSSSPNFFKRGMTKASLYSSGKVPVERDILTMSVITGNSRSIHFRSKSVGMGSKLQDLQGDLKINFLTSSIVRVRNDSNT